MGKYAPFCNPPIHLVKCSWQSGLVGNAIHSLNGAYQSYRLMVHLRVAVISVVDIAG